MKKIFIVAKKEIIDQLRDKRTLITMIVIPLFLFPLIFNVMGKITSNQEKKEMVKTLQIGVVDENNGAELILSFNDKKDLNITKYKSVTEIDTLLKSGKLDGAIVIDKSFDSDVSSMKTGQITLFYKFSNWSVKERLMAIINSYKSKLVSERLTKLNIDQASINPVNLAVQDVSTSREKFGKTIGGMLPYIFVIFSFIGCMYPSIDLFTNEKERGTLETILASPANRIEILFGKMIVVALIGLMSAILSMVGLSFGLNQFAKTLPPDVLGSLSGFIRPENILLLLGMLLPLIIFFAGILTLITTYAKSYKEAQSIISPMMIFIIMPAVIGLIPGIELTALTAIIPITNISLATKEIIAGTLNFGLYALVVCSLLVYASISVFASTIWFSNETHIIKS